MPNFPYLPFKGERIKGFDLLADYLWSADGLPANTSSPVVSVEAPAPVAEGVPDVAVIGDSTSPWSKSAHSASPEATDAPGQTIAADFNESTSVAVVTTAAAPSARVVPNVEPAGLSPEPSIPHTEFMILNGDFVYADVPWYGGDDVEGYRRLYRRVYASPSFRKVYERLREFAFDFFLV